MVHLFRTLKVIETGLKTFKIDIGRKNRDCNIGQLEVGLEGAVLDSESFTRLFVQPHVCSLLTGLTPHYKATIQTCAAGIQETHMYIGIWQVKC